MNENNHSSIPMAWDEYDYDSAPTKETKEAKDEGVPLEIWQRSSESFVALGGDQVRYGMAIINAYNAGRFDLSSHGLHRNAKSVILIDRASSERLTKR